MIVCSRPGRPEDLLRLRGSVERPAADDEARPDHVSEPQRRNRQLDAAPPAAWSALVQETASRHLEVFPGGLWGH